MNTRARQSVGLAVMLFLLGSTACALRDTGGTPSDIAPQVRSRRQQWNVAFANRDSTAPANDVDALQNSSVRQRRVGNKTIQGACLRVDSFFGFAASVDCVP